ncbi:MAG: flagellar hook-length control protein FliK [Rhizomicrobium sp.]
MALASANAVSPTPAVSNTTGANASAALAGNGTGGTFTDSLEAVLAPQGASASGAGDDGTHLVMFGHGKLAKLKNKLKSGDPALGLAPQQFEQQGILQKLQAGNSGIDIPSLRAAMTKGGHVGKHTTPALNPVTGKIEAAKPASSGDGKQTPLTPADMAALQAGNAAAPGNSDVSNSSAKSPQADASKTAAHAASQKKLAAALLKTAQAPVLKTGQDDGSKVPNAKIASAKPSGKSSDKTDTAAMSADAIEALGAKMAATAGATHAPDTAHSAARSVAVAEVTAQKTAAAPTVTKLENAAMSNATQVATHQAAPQEKVEAQALPVQFGVAAANPKDGQPSAQGGQDKGSDKNPAQSGAAHAASQAQKSSSPAPQVFAADQQSSAHTTATATATVNPDTGNGTAMASAPVQPSHIATTLQVSQQPQNNPLPDQTAFADLGVAIAARSKDGEKQFDINLHPADLGKIDVRISVDSSGQAQAHLTAEHPQTLQLLKQDQATLAQNLRDAGLNLANSGLNFSLKGEQQSSTPTFNARSRALSIAAVQTPDIVSTSSSASIAPGDSRLDIRV